MPLWIASTALTLYRLFASEWNTAISKVVILVLVSLLAAVAFIAGMVG